MTAVTTSILPSLARQGLIGIGIPARHGGSGGDLADLFDAVSGIARTSHAAARILAVQRHFAEVLLASENIGVAEYRLVATLDGSMSGACTATWPERAAPPLAAREAGMAWRVSGALPALPNVGPALYLVTALLQPDVGRPPCLALLGSDQDGLVRQAVPAPDAVEGDDSAALSANNVFFRADEILQEDATTIVGELARFATFLRCAIDAGRARRAVEALGASAGAGATAALARTVSGLLRPGRSRRGLPGADELRTAARSLQRLHAAAADQAPSTSPG
jgi:alkylation response protein AidB-like acyl-CoA dehydrogenase